jgi:hypothetical protein
MATAPYGVRLLVGAATFAVEETLKLPKTILMYPMTLASLTAHIVMRFQQNMAELVIKGDSTLEQIFPPKEEQPEWATFDEDLDGAEGDADASGARLDGSDAENRAEGRFALYTAPDPPAGGFGVDHPLTLAQLRARLQTLDLDELEALLAYEEATKARAPFQTLLANRITRATAK